MNRSKLAALAVVVAAIGAALVPGSASATEPPQPDPVTYNVVLAHPVEHVTISVTTNNLTPRGYHCASVWSTVANPANLGHACSRLSATYPVPITLDARTFPAGRSQIEITDDAAGPPRVFPVTAYIVARRVSSFGKGTWEDRGQGTLYVRAPIYLKDPVTGKLRPQNRAPVQVRNLTRRGWRTVATLYSVNGIAQGFVHIAPGVYVLDAFRPTGATVTATTGAPHKQTVNTEPVNPRDALRHRAHTRGKTWS